VKALLLPILLLPLLVACSTGFDPNECRAPRYLGGYEMRYEDSDIKSFARAQQLQSLIGVVSQFRIGNIGETSFRQLFRFIHVPTGRTIWSFNPDVLLRTGDNPQGSDCICVNDSTFLLSCSFGKTMRYYYLMPATQNIRLVAFAGISGRTWSSDRAGIVTDPLITTPDGRQSMLLEGGTLLVELATGQVVDSAFSVTGPGVHFLSSSVDGKRMLTWTPMLDNTDQLFINDIRIDKTISATSWSRVALRSDGMQVASIRLVDHSTSSDVDDRHIIIERWDCSDLGSIRRIASVDVTAATCRYGGGMPIAITVDGSVITTGYRAADLSGYDVITVNAADNSVRVFR
jgi:hypothetical protein